VSTQRSASDASAVPSRLSWVMSRQRLPVEAQERLVRAGARVTGRTHWPPAGGVVTGFQRWVSRSGRLARLIDRVGGNNALDDQRLALASVVALDPPVSKATRRVRRKQEN